MEYFESSNSKNIEYFENEYGDSYTLERFESNRFEIYCYSGQEILEIDEASFLLPERLIRNEITSLYGDIKSGKTFLAILLALCCAIGREFWGQKFPSEGSNVVYYAAERPQQVRDRVEAACKFLGLTEIPAKFQLVFANKSLKLQDEENLQKLCQLVRVAQPSLIIFDTYARMNNKDEDSKKESDINYDQLMKVLASSNAEPAGILVHHCGKTATKKMRGSSALSAAVGAIWLVNKGSNGLIELAMEECNAVENVDSIYFTIESVICNPDRRTGEIRKIGVAVQASAPHSTKNREERICQIISSSSGGEVSASYVQVMLVEQGDEVSLPTVSRHLANMKKNGRIGVSGGSKNSKYFLAPEEEIVEFQ